ncbi:SHOCT domain-containing protein [Clostridium sp. OM05-6BH]|uniref:SHOCT domain-containing protein n=1 Tax=unclassified Clostridium TaxID=2614128 RepID=UPI000E4CB807|nr:MULTISPECIES: SHOCT domain-containing protein [unclassified Clostridium]RHV16821.1 SHOCT domain-containing protein [Clostridium sp. OM05-9BH]RHV20854.1 SHOCT domain-containing protein [Clostridium sp. OM05-6BH]
MSDKQGNVPQFSDYEKELLLDGGWQCSFCERVNANYVGSCACGHNKKDSDLNRLGLYEEYVEKTGQKLETPAAQMASAEEAKEDAASVETTVSQPAQPEPEAPKPVKNKYIYEDTELGEYEQDLIDDGGWQCGFCRRINAYYITSCACGHNKDDSDLKHLGKYVDPEDEYYEDDEYYEEEDEVAATETPASQPVTPQAVPTQATVSQAAHTATPVQSGAQPQARPVQPQAQAVQPQASVQPQVQAQPVQPQASVQPQVQAQPVQRQASVQPQVQAQPVQQRASVQQAQPQVQATSATPVQPAKVQQAATLVQPKIQAQPIAKPESPFIDYDDEEPVAATAQTPVQSQVQAQPVQQQAPVQPAQPQVQAQPVQPTPAQPVQQQNPVQTQPAQPAVDNSAQNAATLKSNIEDQILEDLKKNNYSDVAIVRANRKYKELVKKGIMTQDEFNTKMHELLPTEEEPEEEAASDAENAESNE